MSDEFRPVYCDACQRMLDPDEPVLYTTCGLTVGECCEGNFTIAPCDIGDESLAPDCYETGCQSQRGARWFLKGGVLRMGGNG